MSAMICPRVGRMRVMQSLLDCCDAPRTHDRGLWLADVTLKKRRRRGALRLRGALGVCDGGDGHTHAGRAGGLCRMRNRMHRVAAGEWDRIASETNIGPFHRELLVLLCEGPEGYRGSYS